MAFYKLFRTEIFLSKPSLSARIDTSPVGGPQAHDEAHRCATSWAQGDERLRGDDPRWLASDGMGLQDHPAEGVGRDGTACMEQAEVADFHAAVREHVLEEPAEKLHDVKGGGAWACTCRCTVGEGDHAVLEADKALGGESDPEARGGEGGAGGVSGVLGLTLDVPGDGPDLWGDVLQQSGLAHVFLKESAGER